MRRPNQAKASVRGSRLLVLMIAGLVAGLTGVVRAEQPTPPATPPGVIEFVAKNALATANGVFHRWHIAEARVDLGDLADSRATVVVDLSSVDTGIARRDAHLQEPDFFDVARFPVARVTVHSPRARAGGPVGPPRFDALFEIDLHGVLSTVEGELVVVRSSPLVIEGSLTVDRMVFGVGDAPRRWSPFSIDAHVPVRFRVELDGAAAGSDVGPDGEEGRPESSGPSARSS